MKWFKEADSQRKWVILPTGERIVLKDPTSAYYWQDHKDGMFTFVKRDNGSYIVIAGAGTEPYGTDGEKHDLQHDQTGARLGMGEVIFSIKGSDWEANPQVVVGTIGKTSVPYYVFK